MEINIEDGSPMTCILLHYTCLMHVNVVEEYQESRAKKSLEKAAES